MIVSEVEIYAPVIKDYIPIEAIVDTGASLCVIPRHIVEELGIKVSEQSIHLWQVRDPLTLFKAVLNLRYQDGLYKVEATVVEIPREYRRNIKPGEECKRPSSPHPLTHRMILGENFLNQLPKEARAGILLVNIVG